MKISVFKDDDEGYANYLSHRPTMVYVNGELLDNVTRLDTEAGWAQFTPKGEDGLFIVEDGEIISDYVEGLVEVVGIGLPIVQPKPEEEEDE